MSRQEAEGIIEKTHDAFLGWRKTAFSERAEILRKTAELIRERQDDYAALMTREMGKTLTEGKQECELCGVSRSPEAPTRAGRWPSVRVKY